ncbi:homocysteine S-methyltransferase [Microbacterium sp. 4R-513]|uniref:homocysteine S-methyltransferase n=1 Tax=Microbacterium sp. 4R-513 TaxID=2567934 RepID=UPI0013E1FC7F|nr:homocysteine S-methyltransferase [Microbacterium sp. 4R-513]QIG40853.1 homocysteine S-methyltransferase [Microbacterium sp. 4R-513]
MLRLTDALAAGPVVLDGGLGTLLEERGNDLSSSLWSARLLLDEPGEIRAAHEAFFAAGARVAITASYQVSYEALEAEGLDAPTVDLLLMRSVALARRARADTGHDHDAWVAASVGPYGATLADGSEYTGDYGLTTAELREWHRPRLQSLAGAGPDVLAIETIPSLDEVAAIAAELRGLGVPAWLSVTIAGDRLRTGESLAEAFAIADAADEIVAVGVNCCDAVDVEAALTLARSVTDKPLVAYPNSGEVWDADDRSWSGHGGELAGQVGGWLAAGARLVGGCCRVGPAQIHDVAEAVAAGAPGRQG